MPKMFSRKTEPVISPPTLSPSAVTIGARALRRMWRPTTARAGKPLARADREDGDRQDRLLAEEAVPADARREHVELEDQQDHQQRREDERGDRGEHDRGGDDAVVQAGVLAQGRDDAERDAEDDDQPEG